MARTVTSSQPKGNRAPDKGAKKSHGNPSNMHASRGMSTTRNQRRAGGAGLQGLSVGQKVPMKMFETDYKNKPNQTQVEEGPSFQKKAKKALGKGQKKFLNI